MKEYISKRRHLINLLVIFVFYLILRSIVEKVNILILINSVVSVILFEVWEVISNPSIFIALLIVVLLITYKKNLESLIPFLKELSAAGVSLKFDYPTSDTDKQIGDVITENTGKESSEKSQKKNFENNLVKSLEIGACKLILEMDNKTLSTNELANLIFKNDAFSLNNFLEKNNIDGNGRISYAMGIVHVLVSFPFLWLYSLSPSEDAQTVHFRLYSGIREMLESHIELLKNKPSLKR